MCTSRGTTVPVWIEKFTWSTRGALCAEITFSWIVVRCCELTCTPACDRVLAFDCPLVLLCVDEPVVWFCRLALGSCDCRFCCLLSDEALLSDEPWPVVDLSFLSFEA